MSDRLIRTWWALAARGAAALGFGFLTLTWPSITVGGFVALFAAFAVVDGALTLLIAARYRARARDVASPRDLLLLQGIAGTTLGIVALVWADATIAALLALLAVWALATGGLELARAVRYRERLPVPAALAVAGGVQVALGAFLLAALALGVVRVGWEIGAAALAAGALRLALGLRMRAVVRGTRRTGGSPSEPSAETRSELAA